MGVLGLQGAMQGALFGARSLATGMGPVIFAAVFSLFSRSDSRLPFFPGLLPLLPDRPTRWAVSGGASSIYFVSSGGRGVFCHVAACVLIHGV